MRNDVLLITILYCIEISIKISISKSNPNIYPWQFYINNWKNDGWGIGI